MNSNANRENDILSALSAKTYQRLIPHLKNVSVRAGQVLYQPQQEIEYVYFPTTCLFSLVALIGGGETVEAGIVGSEGFLGVPVVLGVKKGTTQAIGQASGETFEMASQDLVQFIQNDDELKRLLLLYTHSFLSQVAQTAACNGVHTLSERLARWLLLTHDRLKRDNVDLTHEFLATMLGTRRAGVSVAAKSLKDGGLIDYSRGHLRIIDRAGLEKASCGCYAILKRQSELFIN